MKPDLQPLVSVVTPIYNEEKYLAECIESVLAQTYTNWEYILVNNYSTDRSLEIAKFYQKKDPRIRVHNNEIFLSQYKNFNHALRQISVESKYCKVVEGDDWLFPECLVRMVELAEADPLVGIVGAYRLDDVHVTCDGLPYPTTVISGRDICRLQLLDGLYVFGSPTSLLIRSDIVRNRDPFYNERGLHSDTEAVYEILQNCYFGFVHQVLTFTRRENESISSTVRNFNPNILDYLIILKTYGHIYLSKAEYAKRLKRIENTYFSFLGKSVLRRRGKKFWNYHREGLKTIGCQLSWIKLSKYVFWELIDIIFNPKKTSERLIWLLKKDKQYK